jgi:thiol-disulfide isomerase/thioredoxin
MRTRLLIVVVTFCGTCLVSAALPVRAADAKTPAGPRRPTAQITTDLQAAQRALPRYRLLDQFDPHFGHQFGREMGPGLQKVVDLFNEFEKADPARGAALRSEKCLAMVRLALWNYGDAVKTLTDLSNSQTPADALFGKVGLLMYRWWNTADDAAQKDVATDFAAMAKANPKEDLLLHAALTMARYRAASDNAANALRDVAEKDLTGPAALKYQHQPYKLGRPFKLSVRTLDGKTIEVANWRGKVVVVDFWATWCPPCVATVPKLVQLYQDGHPKGLEFLGISNDSNIGDLKAFLASHKEMAWPESFNPSGREGWHALAAQMDVHAIPTTFIVDRNGILRSIESGFLDEKLIKQLIQEQVKPEAAATPVAAPVAGTGEPGRDAKSEPAAAAANPTAGPDPNEKPAQAMLSLANSYISIKRPDRAAEKLGELIQKFPNTQAAQKAKQLLADLNQR